MDLETTQTVDNPDVNITASTDPTPGGPENTPSGDPTQGLENPLLKLLRADESKPSETQPVNNEPAPEPQDIPVPDKFKNPDGTVNVNALLKSYTSLEGKLGEQGNQLGQMQALQQKVEQLSAMLQQKQEPPKPQWTEEQIQKMNEDFLQEFYDNPLQSLGKLVNILAQQQAKSVVDPVLQKFEPILSEREQQKQMEMWNSQVQEVAQANVDEFIRLKDTMNEVIKTQADIINALPDTVNKAQYVFNQAKAIDAARNKPKSPDELLNDPEFLQKIAQNDTIKNMILKSHVEAVKSGQPPVVITNTGGQPPAAPTTEIKNTRDATKAATSYFTRLLGGGM